MKMARVKKLQAGDYRVELNNGQVVLRNTRSDTRVTFQGAGAEFLRTHFTVQRGQLLTLEKDTEIPIN